MRFVSDESFTFAFFKQSEKVCVPTSIEYSGFVIPLGTLGYFVLYPDSLACIGSFPFPPDSCIIIACNKET